VGGEVIGKWRELDIAVRNQFKIFTKYYIKEGAMDGARSTH
jgi:hypothetical protein